MELIYKCSSGHYFKVEDPDATDPVELAHSELAKSFVKEGCGRCGEPLFLGGQVSTVFYWRVMGGHVHVRVFSGPVNCTRGKNGNLIFTLEEWVAFRETTSGPEDGTLSFAQET